MTHSPTVRIGIDAGLTLTKLAIEAEDGDIRFEKLASADRRGVVERVAELLEPSNTPNVGLTGGGATQLSTALPTASAAIGEFAAWGSGARNLVAESDAFSATDEPAPQRFMMVSLGTGTSVLLVDGLSAQRIGGTALGGGTVMGLGRALTKATSFEELCALAAKGDSKRVDLIISDIYQAGEIALPTDATASSFGRVGREGPESATAEDLAAGVMNLVSENIALLCGSLSNPMQARHVAFGGSTLCANPTLATGLASVLAMLGCQCAILTGGEYAGALGALELLRARA